ncbi:MAG: PA14 domain-containing protein [Candidatus Promineifilaceae bacterium]|nr:PA14 domain-containing protein [Candidatus Promineifilaceae bacterium]
MKKNRRIYFVSLAIVLVVSLIVLGAGIARAQQDSSAVIWQASYWTNIDLRGEPIVQGVETDLNYNWGTEAPNDAIAPDGFSARWTAEVTLPEGVYRFVSRSDDGIRVWVNGTRIIDHWTVHSEAVDTATIPLDAGTHSIRVEYFENTGLALVSLDWERVDQGEEEVVDILPESGPPGTVVEVTAHGFTPNDDVRVAVGRANSEPTTAKTAFTDEAGGLNTSIIIPADEASPGEPWVVLVGNIETGESALSETFTVTSEEAADCGPTVVVQPGDWLARIARRCGTSIEALLAANPQISNPSVIQPGQVLEIPQDPAPQVGITPNEGQPGTEIRVSAIGFPPNSVASVGIGRANSEPTTSKTVTTDAEGTVETTITLPAEAAPGTPWVILVSTGEESALSESFTVTGAAVTATTQFNLNLRPLPDLNTEPIEIVPAGTEVPILGQTPEGEWFLIRDDGRRGWIAGWLTNVLGNLSDVPVETP